MDHDTYVQTSGIGLNDTTQDCVEYSETPENLLYADEERLDSEEELTERTDEELNIRVHIKGNEIVLCPQNEAPCDRKKNNYLKLREINELRVTAINGGEIKNRRLLSPSTQEESPRGQPFIKTIYSHGKQGLLCELNRNPLSRVKSNFAPLRGNSVFGMHTLTPLNQGKPDSLAPGVGWNSKPWLGSVTESIVQNSTCMQEVSDLNVLPRSTTVQENMLKFYGNSVGMKTQEPDVGGAIKVTKVMPVIVQPVYNQNGYITVSKKNLAHQQSSPPAVRQKTGNNYLTMDQKDFRRLLPTNELRKEWNSKLCVAKERKHVKELMKAFENLRLHLPRLKRHKRMTTKLMILKEAASYIKALYKVLGIDTEQERMNAALPDMNSPPDVLSNDPEQPKMYSDLVFQPEETDMNNNRIPLYTDDIAFVADHEEPCNPDSFTATEDIIRTAYVESCLLVDDKDDSLNAYINY